MPINEDTPHKRTKTERDLVAIGIAAAAIIMFVGTGCSVVPQGARNLMGAGEGPG